MQFAKLQTISTSKEDGRIFLSENEVNDELGKLIIFGMVPKNKLSGLPHFEDLVRYLQDAYYNSETDSPEQALESLLEELNQVFDSYFPGLKPEEAQRQAAFFIGVIKGNELFFSKSGQIKLMLQHGETLIDILKEGGDEEIDNNVFFSYVTSGKLGTNDSLLVTTLSLLDYFSEQKLKQILTNQSADFSISEFSSLVEEFSHHTFFQALVIKNTVPVTPKEIFKPAQTINTAPAQTSISVLNALEDKTGELLTNSVFVAFSNSFKALIQQVKAIFSRDYATSESGNTEQAIRRRLRQKNIFARIGDKLWLGVKTIGVVLMWFGQQFLNIFLSIFKHRQQITQSIKKHSSGIPGKIQKKVNTTSNKFRGLDKKRKQILLTGAGLALILLLSIGYGITRQATTVSREEALAIFDEIELKKAAADAALIYGNDSQAVAQIAEARNLLNELQVRSDDLKERKTELANSLFETYKSIQKLVEIDSPTLLADLSVDNEGNQLSMISLTGSGDTFYGYNAKNTIYEFSISEGSGNALVQLDFPILKLTQINDTELLIYSDSEDTPISILDTRSSLLTPVSIEFVNLLTQKADFESYFGRLYVLDPRERQIYRHNASGSGYGRGQGWVSDSTVDLSDATDMVIDGTIWVITSSGNVYHLDGGEKIDYNVTGIDPILNSPNFIWTSLDSEKLYILDPPTRRIVILNKTGGVYKQFVSERFDDLKSAAIDEANNKLYVLNSSQVYELDIE